MATQYFRITAYCPEKDFCFIMDSNGMFEKLWEFCAFVRDKGMKILEASNAEQFKDINIDKAEYNSEKIFLRAYMNGQPKHIFQKINGSTYNAVQVEDKIYIP